MSELIENYFHNDTSVNIIKEEAPLGTGGSIKNAINFLKLNIDDSILVLNGDTYIKPNLTDFTKDNYDDITIMSTFQNNCDRSSTLKIRNNKVIDFYNQEIGKRNSYINVGCYFFQNLTFFKTMTVDKFAIEDKFRQYSMTKSLSTFIYDGVFIDIGIPEDYIKMKKYMSKNENG